MRPHRSDVEAAFESNRYALHGKTIVDGLTEWRDGMHLLSVDFTLSDRCPHKCPGCIDGNDQVVNGTVMEPEVAVRILHDLGAAGVKSVNFEGGGEPTVGPFAEAAQACEDAGMQFGLITNGSTLHIPAIRKSALRGEYVRVSLDAASASRHAVTHGSGDFDRIVNGVGALVHERDQDRWSRTIIGLGYLLDAKSLPYAGEFLDLASGLAVDYVAFRPKFEDGAYFLCDTITKRQFRYDLMHWLGAPYVLMDWDESEQPLAKKCEAHMFKVLVGADSGVYVCCNKRGDRNYLLGVMTEGWRIRDVWRSVQRQAVVDALTHDRQDMNKHCSVCNASNLNRVCATMRSLPRHWRFLG